MEKKISKIIEESIIVKQLILQDQTLQGLMKKVAETMIIALKAGNKILFCGNGGSAADAQHLSCELSGRFFLDRPALFAEALHVNTSTLTAVGNDFGFSEVFARQVQAQGRTGDVLVALSTSGNSENIIRAIQEARKKGMVIIGFSGLTGGKMATLVDILINVPSKTTPRIQEAHIMIGHIVCEIVEATIFPKSV